jgi:hypothetical protein
MINVILLTYNLSNSLSNHTWYINNQIYFIYIIYHIIYIT